MIGMLLAVYGLGHAILELRQFQLEPVVTKTNGEEDSKGSKEIGDGFNGDNEAIAIDVETIAAKNWIVTSNSPDTIAFRPDVRIH